MASIDPSALDAWLADDAALVLDIRPHAAYASARLPGALSLSVPSTLLKRPLFSLDRLALMLPSQHARSRFSAWPSASRILVYDADSSTLPDASNLAGLIRKFRADGFDRDLCWLRGGFQSVWRDHRHLVDTSPPPPDIDHDDNEKDSSLAPNKPPVLRPRHLPTAAFSLSSTTIHHSAPHTTSRNSLPPPRLPSMFDDHPPSPISHSQSAFNPFFDTIRQNTELSHGITDRIPLRLPHRVRRRIPDLPFTWLQDIAKRAASAPRRHRNSTSNSSSSDEDDDGASSAEIEEGKEALAMQFFKIELSEQRRLMGVMEHHSKETDPATSVFPYSITAGVEKGAKNRYRHIWPFEHARVRLHRVKTTDDDYINASYIQPLSTAKRYIATQGPLPDTFTDFWTLCWEQNVHVILMLTRQVEGAVVKCGQYWSDTVFGPLRLRPISTEGIPQEHDPPSTGGFFPAYSPHPPPSKERTKPPSQHRQKHQHQHYHTKRSETVKRVFELTHTGYPDAKPRRIVHLQYLEWPDMNVPDDPRGVLGLIKQVEEAVKETQTAQSDADPNITAGANAKKRRRKGHAANEVSVDDIDEKTGIAKHALGGGSNPLLLHCSAGVGRTGGFIVVDAVLDAIRRELRAKLAEGGNVDDSMEVCPDDETSPAVAQSRSRETETAPLTMNATENRASDNLVVHVPLASPMQVDPSENEIPSQHGKTMQWVENVHDETGIASNEPLSTSPSEGIPPRNNSPLSYSGTSISNTNTSLLGSSEGAQRSGNSSHYYSNSSSSLGTSMSGTSSSYYSKMFPASISSTSFMGMGQPAMMAANAELLYAALNNQQEARLRTMSAPAPSTIVQRRGLGAHIGKSSTLPHPMPLSGAGTSMDVDGDTVNAVKPSGGQRQEQQLNPPPSDDAEPPPSRSQSPSADEGGLPPRTKEAVMTTDPKTMHSVPTNTSPLSLSSHPLFHSEQLSPPHPSSQSPIQSQRHSYSPTQNKTTFHYKEPRPLHEDVTPPLLTTFDDPIWEVVQDVREQRMSLCQSLRQYVFVHAAIVEGALMVVDEERERMKNERECEANEDARLVVKVPETLGGKGRSRERRLKSHSHSQSRSPTKRRIRGQPSKTQMQPHSSSSYDMPGLAATASSSSSSASPPLPLPLPPGPGKRGASPTELVKEDEQEDDEMPLLPKRPSVKRKQRSGDDLRIVDGARYHPVPVRVSSSMMYAGGVSAPTTANVIPNGAVAAVAPTPAVTQKSVRAMPP